MTYHRFSIIQGRAVQDGRVTDAQLRTLGALGMYADKDGWCFPSQSSLADDVGKSRKTVNEHIKALVELGYVESRPQFKKDGGQTSNKYRLLFDVEVDEDVTPPVSNPEVTPLSSLDVTGSVTPEGYTNDSSNDPTNAKAATEKPDIVDGVLHFAKKEAEVKEATNMFEKAFGFGSLPWHSNTTWDRFRSFVVAEYKRDRTAFGSYAVWRGEEGKYRAMSNKQIRMNPLQFIDTGWPEFLAENQVFKGHKFIEGV